MKKLSIILIFVLVISALVLVSQGCKSSPTTPATSTPAPYYSPTITPTITKTSTNTLTLTSTMTLTNTPTFTVTSTITPTITPDNSAQNFNFEDGTAQGWFKDNGAPATASAAVTSGTVHSGSYGLAIGCAYSSSDDLVQIKHTFTGTPMYLRNRNIYAWIYVSPAMFGAGTFHPELTLVSYAGTALPGILLPDIGAAGWSQAAFTVPDTVDYEMIGEARIGLRNDLATTYTDFLYIDDISW